MNRNEIDLKNKAILNKDNSLNRLYVTFLKHIELSEYKKSNLLAYWINDFAEYHDEERIFDIAKSGIYSRGDVIKVNLGFNIGKRIVLLWLIKWQQLVNKELLKIMLEGM